MRYGRRTLTALLAAALLAAGCQTGEPQGATATVPASAPPEVTDPEPTDPSDPAASPTGSDDVGIVPLLPPEDYALPTDPADLDAAYFEKVLQGLFSVIGEAVRIAVEADTGTLPDGTVERISASFDTRRQPDEYRNLEEGARAGFPDTRRPPGDLTVTVERVVTATPECAWVAGLRDFGAVGTDPVDRTGQTDYFVLLPIQPGQDPWGHNPTPWVLGGDVVQEGPGEPENPCLP